MLDIKITRKMCIRDRIDASVSDFMTTARLYCSGLNFTYNPHRLLLNKVTDVYLVKDGQRVEPVSYTHLDVYKRQAPDRSSCR